MSHLRRCRAGFTLIELLVVIAIVIILASLLVPAVNRARVAARVADTQTELRSLSAALEVFQNEFGILPPVTKLDDNGNPIEVYVNVQFLEPDYRSGDTSGLSGDGGENWQLVRVVGDDPWVWEDNNGDGYSTSIDLLDAAEVDLPELLYLMVATKFARTDDSGARVGVLRVVDNATGRERIYYAKSDSAGPYAELRGSRTSDLDGDTYPEVLDSFRNPIIYTLGLRNPGAAELTSLGPDGKLDFVDLNDNGSWDGGEPGNNGIDDDNDGLVDEKADEINNKPELYDDIVTWE